MRGQTFGVMLKSYVSSDLPPKSRRGKRDKRMAEAKGINPEITPEVVSEEVKEMVTEYKEEVKEVTAEMVDAIRPARKRRADKVRKLARELAKPRNKDIGWGGLY